ncbi:MAG TPA: DUF3488 and transglutaminase-like domain-containing protein, partial [Candidatus Hydrogenedentes bacterium]|nr:DUF3488 and transglutaminase-like domain-containing protein [Candidatus Hydrogenedentota bacterium]
INMVPFTDVVLVLLVIFIQAYLLLHTKDVRQYHHLALMALFMVLAALVQGPEPAIGLVLVLYLLCTVWTFIALRLHADAAACVAPPHVSQSPDAEPRRGLHWRVGVSVVMISAGVFAFTAAFFILTPRTEAGLFGREIQFDRPRTGFTERVDLAGGGAVEQDTTAVMHVEFPDLPDGRYPGPMYWRTTTLNQYADSEWSRRGLTDNLESQGIAFVGRRRTGFPFGGGGEHVSRFHNQSKHRVRQLIYMDDVPERGVPCLDLVHEVTLVAAPRGARLYWDGSLDFTVGFETVGARRMTYEVWSEVGESDPSELRAASADYEAVLAPRDFQLLTSHELLPETEALARRVTADAASVFDQALRLQQWLSGPAFTYTLDLPLLPREYAIDVFINQTRRGHCELFASALALMLRSLGVPTRVVSGFRGGEYIEGNQSYTVRASDAHLWVEMLILGHGWVIFDPSPRVEPDALGQIERFSRSFSRFTLEMKMFWYQEIIGFDRAMQLEQIRGFTARLAGFVPGIGRWVEPKSVSRGAFLSVRVLLFGGFVAALVFWIATASRPKRPRYAFTRDQARAGRLYRRVLRRMRWHGLAATGSTAEELLESWKNRRGGDPGPLREVLDAYNAARFGGRPLTRKHYVALLRRLRTLRD